MPAKLLKDKISKMLANLSNGVSGKPAKNVISVFCESRAVPTLYGWGESK